MTYVPVKTDSNWLVFRNRLGLTPHAQVVVQGLTPYSDRFLNQTTILSNASCAFDENLMAYRGMYIKFKSRVLSHSPYNKGKK